jgi:hypothetical protein
MAFSLCSLFGGQPCLDSYDWLCLMAHPGSTDHTVPYGTGPIFAHAPGSSCLATIVSSLRDKHMVPLR